MNRKITLIAAAATALALTSCDVSPEPASDTAKECDVTQTAYEQQFQPVDYNGDGWLVMCVSTALIVPTTPSVVAPVTPVAP